MRSIMVYWRSPKCTHQHPAIFRAAWPVTALGMLPMKTLLVTNLSMDPFAIGHARQTCVA